MPANSWPWRTTDANCVFCGIKVVELGDTAFIVLRRRPLIFLHWYHHVSVMMYVWFSYAEYAAPGLWFMALNYTVHSFMYTYYAARAARFHIPRPISISITAMQIFQMAVGLAVTWSSFQARVLGRGGRWSDCRQSYESMAYGSAMYLSYLVLFVHFFYVSYVRPSRARLTAVNGVNGMKKVD